MLQVFRRHNPKKCKLRSRSQYKCRCPLWIDARIDGVRVRKPLKTRNWAKAQRDVRQWERDGVKPVVAGRATVEQWKEAFLQDAKSRLASETLRKYKHLFAQLTTFSSTKGLVFVGDLDLAQLTTFKAGWKDARLSAGKKIERLRSMFKFALERGWVRDNPAKKLVIAKAKLVPTLPFTQDEMDRIIKAAEKDQRLLAFIYCMRFGGLRISDATTLAVTSLQDGLLHLHTEKTGEAVRIPLPGYVVKELKAVKHKNPNYFFWSGTSKVQAAVSVWRRRLADVFTTAKVPNAHSHRLRDSFACGLLTGGVSIEDVAKLLGHSSIAITEKHYAPWVRTRQDALARAVQKVYEIGTELD
jgi:integrase/recombinase XerD